jgi:diguanylate cyclase (GGDEF)-like protein
MLFCGFAVLLIVTVVAVVLAMRAEGHRPITEEAGHAPLPAGLEEQVQADRAEREAAMERGREMLNSLLQGVGRNVSSHLGDVGQYDSSLETHRASLQQARTSGEAEDVGQRILEEIERMHQTNLLYKTQLERANQVIEEQRQELQKLSLDATTDFLTQIPNRRTLDARLREEFARFKRGGPAYCVVLMDVDHFKAINDDHGHLVGDEVLVKLTQVLMGARREMDFLGRYGGEEFALLLPATRHDEAEQIADRLRVAVADATIACGASIVRATVSAGVSEALPSDPGIEDSLKRADEALYKAKTAGRNRVSVAH